MCQALYDEGDQLVDLTSMRDEEITNVENTGLVTITTLDYGFLGLSTIWTIERAAWMYHKFILRVVWNIRSVPLGKSAAKYSFHSPYHTLPLS
jgi:hypothetical protein